MAIDEMLATARSRLHRLHPVEAAEAAAGGARMVDIRPQFQRQADGEIPGAIVIERNHLEWRLDPTSAGRIPEATGYEITWIVICHEGYSSSLAAASLQRWASVARPMSLADSAPGNAPTYPSPTRPHQPHRG